jgi:hypothetical protein
VADLLLGRFFGRFDLVLSCLGRFDGLVVLPVAASLASLSASSFPGIPVCLGVHLTVMLFRWCLLLVLFWPGFGLEPLALAWPGLALA